MQLNNSASHRVREEIYTIKRQGVAQRDQHFYHIQQQLAQETQKTCLKMTFAFACELINKHTRSYKKGGKRNEEFSEHTTVKTIFLSIPRTCSHSESK